MIRCSEQYVINVPAADAPLIGECYASFECQLADNRLIEERGLFVWDVVKAHVAPTPKNPKTIHYRGDGQFMIGGKAVDMKRRSRQRTCSAYQATSPCFFRYIDFFGFAITRCIIGTKASSGMDS